MNTDTPTPGDKLRRIAAWLDQGLPIPTGITPYTEPVMIQISPEDLPDWLIALDAPDPEWVFADVTGQEHANVVAGGFVLTACRQPCEAVA